GTVDFEPSRIEQIYYDSKDRCVLNAVQELKMFCRAGGGDPSAEYRDNTDGLKGVILSCGDERGDYYDIEWQSYRLEEKNGRLVISSQSSCGVLWGVFDLIRRIRCGEKLNGLNATCVPDNPFRMLNHWDNDDGSVERGYSGNSFFFKDGEIIVNERIKAYARFLASVGINAIVINNVNVKDNAVYFITERYFDRLNELTELFAEYGVRLFLSVDYAASIDIGGLDSADPCSAEVIAWWEEKCAEIYRNIHGLGGFLIKADSEGRPGPFTYGRNQAQGANMLARALQPYGGIVIWRCFVYNCNQDWRDRKTDRARAAYDYFSRLDGQFDDNVILQIKNGPVDFQVREPVSPLLGAMRKTNQMIEFQIAQEYTGQQIDLCYLIPWFKEVLDFRMYLNDSNDTVADYISGRAYGGKLCGCAAVTNTGNDFNWTGHDLAAANLYGFGRLCFDSSLSAELIAKEWIVQTFGRSAQVIRVISEMLMKSWQVYEKYTAPLGIGWMVRREDHYGVDVDAYEYSRWGTYHYA
ncbi:MAG: alpha-glucuronidase, partial [Candidatus Ornithomonoglobus sp.]